KGEKATVGDVIGYLEEGEGARPSRPERTQPPVEAPRPAEETTSPRPPEAEAQAQAQAQASTSSSVVHAKQPISETPSQGRSEEVIPMTPIRRRIAERLVQAQKSAALLTTFNQIDMSEVIALRKKHQDSFVSRFGIKLGFMSFFVKASIEALKLVPQINAE